MRLSSGVRLVRVFGIDIRAHISLVLLLLYLMVVIATQFQAIADAAQVDPGELHFGPVAWSLILGISLMVCIVLHELAHGLVAQSVGVKVKSITLMMLGGVCSIDQVPQRPSFELGFAIAGPLMSLAIGGILLLVNARTSVPDLIFFSHWLGRVNIALAAFNLLPAFPLDGGRVFRALLAFRLGMRRATEAAVTLSTVFAFFLGTVGIMSFNFILLLIALFVYSAAQSERYFLASRALVRGLKVKDLLVNADALSDSATLLEAAREMQRQHKGILPVRRFDGSSGLISLSQILSVRTDLRAEIRVAEITDQAEKAVSIHDDLGEIMPDLASAPLQCLPVHERGALTGYLRLSDITEVAELHSLSRKPLDQDRDENEPRRAA